MRKMFSTDEIVSSVNGVIKDRTPSSSKPMFVSGVSSDTRTIGEDDLYIAIKGERFDGHDFCLQAFEKGSRVMIVSDEEKIPEGVLGIVVEDTVKALGLLARHYRFKINAKVVAVTGSVGKTSTREMIACALSAMGKTWSTKFNLNNDIGLPQTILSAPEDTEFMVLEMGMRLRGEISYLTNIACPDIAVITNVGFSHIERLGSREEIRLAKTEIIEGLTQNGVLMVNGDDDFLFEYAENIIPIGKILASASIGKEDLEVKNCPLVAKGRNIRIEDGKTVFDLDIRIGNESAYRKDITLGVCGTHHVRNALFGIMCAGTFLKGMPEAAIVALSGYTELAGRGRMIRKNGMLIIDDAYNAAPESMKAAFENLDIAGEGMRKIAVLGGMLELGSYAPMLHEEVGKDCGRHHFDKVIVTGDNSEDLIRGLRSIQPDCDITVCRDTDDVKKTVFAMIGEGDAVLFKASNAFGFSALVKELEND
ncbi:MAG: UDP-N-acetylmuramoyl-tripeptide--D-alanyl-D-alanine ligase [Clostridiales bacterium]|nr:UDP-N-acetylmuramoyl-tripeptide--D-alanyl-D-alanine ligase [Clostridiales bacterium]